MLLQLLKALDTTDLKVVVGSLSMSPLDIDLVLYEAQENGGVDVDRDKGTIKALKEAEPYFDAELAKKLCDTMGFYDRQEANVTRGRLEQNALDLNALSAASGDPRGRYSYPVHDFVCTMYALENGQVPDMPKVYKYVIEVPEIKKVRPFNRFEFFTLEDHQEFGAKAVQVFIDQFNKKKVK